MGRTQRSVRVEDELLERLDELGRKRLVPVTFADQVNAGLRLLIQQAEDWEIRRAAELVAAEQEESSRIHRHLRGRSGR